MAGLCPLIEMRHRKKSESELDIERFVFVLLTKSSLVHFGGAGAELSHTTVLMGGTPVLVSGCWVESFKQSVFILYTQQLNDLRANSTDRILYTLIHINACILGAHHVFNVTSLISVCGQTYNIYL